MAIGIYTQFLRKRQERRNRWQESDKLQATCCKTSYYRISFSPDWSPALFKRKLEYCFLNLPCFVFLYSCFLFLILTDLLFAGLKSGAI